MKINLAKKIEPGVITTYSGIEINFCKPKAEDILIEDIAHALSNVPRYGGHTPKFYSVGQHSVLCSLRGKTYQEQLELLMHDASEAYMLDMPKPIKIMMPWYVEVEDNLMGVIFNKFKLTYPLTDEVHKIDYELYLYEVSNFKNGFEFWDPEEAKVKFLARFYELTRQIENEQLTKKA